MDNTLRSMPVSSSMLAMVDDDECWGEPASGRGPAFEGCSASTSSSSSSSVGSNSSLGRSASSSSEIIDDATSPLDRPSPLYEMAALMADLPIKRGLSRHFQGMSQSFASLAAVTSVDDLAKPDHGLWRQRFSRRRGRVNMACKSKAWAAAMDKGHAPPISPNGRAICKPRKHYSCLARRNITGGGGGRQFCYAAGVGLLPPVHGYVQKHGDAASVSLRRHKQHALLFA